MKAMTVAALVCLMLFPSASPVRGADEEPQKVKAIVDASIIPLMKKFHIAGAAVGISLKGKHYVFNYGVLSTASKRPVTDKTIFEIGSVSKTLTATLTSYARLNGKLSLLDTTSKYLPELVGTSFGGLSLLNLATHTSGGLPLQLPQNVHNEKQLMNFLKNWKPKSKPGTVRNYANPGIGMLGVITARSMSQTFDHLMETSLLRPLTMKNSYLKVPESEMVNYAQGYTDKDEPVRVTDAVLSAEAYGIKTTASDMIRFLDANMSIGDVDEQLSRAIRATHTGYFQTRAMTQDLIWEQYPIPVREKDLLDGTSKSMVYDTTPVTLITPPEKPRIDVLINKTGSTSGFGAYVAFVPKEQIGIVMLANKSCPIHDRVLAAQSIMKRLCGSI